ncbi:MAG: hypothetical protein V2G51_06425 [bacterium JZ-2024 1]
MIPGSVCRALHFAVMDFGDRPSDVAPRSLQDLINRGYFLFWPISGTDDLTERVSRLPRAEREAVLTAPQMPGRFAFWRTENDQAVVLHVACTLRAKNRGGATEIRARETSTWAYHNKDAISPRTCGPSPLCLKEDYLKWKVRMDQLILGIHAYVAQRGVLPEKPEDLVPLMGPMVQKAWTPEVTGLWQEILIRVSRHLQKGDSTGREGNVPLSQTVTPTGSGAFPVIP